MRLLTQQAGQFTEGVKHNESHEHQNQADLFSRLVDLAFDTGKTLTNGIDASLKLIRAVGKVVEPVEVNIFLIFTLTHCVTLSVALLPNKEGTQ